MNRVWIHRHIHKTGGTSIRQLFVNLAVANFVSLHHGWKCTTNLNGSIQSTQTRVFEMHESCVAFNTDVMPIIDRLRVRTQVLLTTFVRKPFDHSISAWMWAGKPSFGKFNRTISYWLPYNMQSNQLLYGDFDRFFMGNKDPRGRLYRRLDDQAFEKLLRIMSHYDVVCPTDVMAFCIQYILKKLNLPSMSIPRIAPSHGRTSGEPINHTNVIAHECKNINCTDLIATRTQYDEQLFAYAQRFVSDRAAEFQIFTHDPLVKGIAPRRNL